MRQSGNRLVDCINPTFLVSFDNVEVDLELFESIFEIVLACVVYHKCHGQKIEGALVDNFTVLCHVLIQIVLLRDTAVKLKVVHDSFLAMFVEKVEFDEV